MVQPVVPEVRCKQGPGRQVPPTPNADEWVEWLPPKPGQNAGVARLSQKGVNWVLDVLGVVQHEKGLRKVEHNCLDDAEKKGLIQQ